MNKCFFSGKDKNSFDQYLPIFWFNSYNKEKYEKIFNIKHSDCYSEYGMRRTGCTGCLFDQRISEDLGILKKYEPQLYKACIYFFGKAYEWQQGYKEYQKEMKAKGIPQYIDE